MGRNLSDHSVSPVRGRRSPRKRSPSRREKAPARHKSSYKESSPVREKPSSHTRSLRRAKSRSPVAWSPGREKPSSHTRSPRRAKLRSPEVHSPGREKPSSRTRSLERAKSRSPIGQSPVREKPFSRARSPLRAKSRSPIARSPVKEKPPSRTRSPKRAPKSISPVSHSPSPWTKRLRRAQAENEAEKVSERGQQRSHRKNGRSSHKERNSEREVSTDTKEKRSGRDAVDNEPSRSRHGRPTSPSDHHRRSRHRSRSPPTATDSISHDEVNNSREGERSRNGYDDSVAKMAAAAEALEKKEKQKPSFELSGKLAEETNRVRGITLLFTEPPDARKPDIRWRLYVFKGGDVLNEPLYVHRQSCYLFGRERRVAEIPTDHPSCSKQHAVLQYRQVEKEQPDGAMSKQVRPYIMDLGSTNGTFINEERIEPHRYYELFEKDTIKFGNSSREYVLLHENSAA